MPSRLGNLEARKEGEARVQPRLELPEETAKRVDALKNPTQRHRDGHFVIPCEFCGNEHAKRIGDFRRIEKRGGRHYCQHQCHIEFRKRCYADAFWNQYEVTSKGCWKWLGSQGGRYSSLGKGYGIVHYMGKVFRTHILSYILTKGPIPKGMCVLHTCDYPTCINPDHLWLGTNQENVDDRMKKGRHRNGHTGKLYEHESRE